MSLSINELQQGKWYTTLNGDGKFKYKPVDNGCIKHTKWIHCKNRGEGTISNDNWWRQVAGLADMEEIYKHFPEENPEEKPKDVPKQEDYTGRWVKALRNGANGIGNIKANTYHKLNRKDIASVSGCYNISFDGLHTWSLHPLDSINWELMPIGFDPNKQKEENGLFDTKDREALLKEAKRRYPIGTKFRVVHKPECILTVSSHDRYELTFFQNGDYLHINFLTEENTDDGARGGTVCLDGKWADIAEMPKNNEFPKDGKCLTLDNRLIDYLKNSRTFEGNNGIDNKGVAWNGSYYWFFKEDSAKPLYSIDFLNKWIPVKIEEPLNEVEIFPGIYTGDIVVRIRGGIWKTLDEGSIIKVSERSSSDNLRPEEITNGYSSEPRNWRKATPEEAEHYHKGVRNINDIPKSLGKPIIFGTAGEITNEQQYAMIATWQNWPSEEKLTVLDVFKPKKSAKMSYIAENSQEARQLSKITKQKSI